MNRSIQAGKSISFHTRLNCDTINLGRNWMGSVYVESDQALVAVIENHFWSSSANDMMAYNSYSFTPR